MRHALPKQILTAALAVGLITCLGCGPKDPDGEGPAAVQSPSEIALKCLETCQQGRTAEALEQYADLDAMARSVFADDFDELDDEKQAAVRNALVQLFEAILDNSLLSNPQEVSLGELTTSETEDGLTCVSCEVTLGNGDLQETRLFFDQIDDQWRIVDMGNSTGTLTTILALARQQTEMPPEEMVKQFQDQLIPMMIEIGGE